MEIIAFVVGVGSYQNYTVLPSAVNDAEKVRDLFLRLNYKVYSSIDQTCEEAKSCFNSFIGDLTDYPYEGAVFYFAGHGCQIFAEECLMLKDAPLERGYGGLNLADKSFKLPDVINHMRIKDDGHVNICLLDCCRDGRSVTQTDLALKNREIPFQTLLAYATTAGDNARTNITTNHGYFTESFLKHYSADVDIETILKAVRKEVYEGSGKLSWVHTCLVDNVFLSEGKEACFLDKPYSRDAYFDWDYEGSTTNISRAFTQFRTHNYYYQAEGVRLFLTDRKGASDDDLFVFGRNLLQAALGNCNQAQTEISSLLKKQVLLDGDSHIINGVLYEMYFDKNNTVRNRIKGLSLAGVVARVLQNPALHSSKAFIQGVLDSIDLRNLFRVDNPTEISVILNLENTYGSDSEGCNIYRIQSVMFRGEDILPSVNWPSANVHKKDLYKIFQEFLQVPSEYIKLIGTRIHDSDFITK